MIRTQPTSSMQTHAHSGLDRYINPAVGPVLWLPLVILLLLGLIWGGTLRLIQVERINAERDASNSTRDLSGIYEVQMMRALHEIDLTLSLVRYACEHRGLAEALPELEREALLPSPLIIAISVANAQGKTVAHSHANESPVIAEQPRFKYFKQATSMGDTLYTGLAEMNPTTRPQRMHFARRISKPNGEFLGVVSATVDLDYFTSAYDKARMGNRGVVGVLDAKGQFLVRRTGDHIDWGHAHQAAPATRAPSQDNSVPSLVINPWDGEQRYTVQQALHAFPFSIVVGLSAAEQLSAFHHSERNHLWLAGAASGLLLAIGFLLWQLSRSQLRIRKAQQTYHVASEASLDAHVVLHSQLDASGQILDFIVTDANSRALMLTSQTPATMLGKQLSALMPERTHQRLLAALSTVMKTGHIADKEWENHDAAIQAHWLHAQVVPAGDGVVTIVRDISERKRFEVELMQRNTELTSLNSALTAVNSELTQAQEQLVQSEKLASIGLLAAGVAHEINNPVGFVLSNIGTLDGYINSLFELLEAYHQSEALLSAPAVIKSIEALREQVEIDYLKEDIPVLMRETKEGIHRVRKIVQDLKDFSRVDSAHEWQIVNLHDGIDSTLNVVNNEIKYKADVVKAYGDLPLVECLPSEINQVVMNLAINAAHAIGAERGTITIRTGRQGEGQSEEAWIDISDTGCGIAPEHLARVFDPFFTTKPVGKGTGLGLSLSYGIIKKHHGRLEVSSEVSKGTTFRITLPVRQAPEPGDAQLPIPATGREAAC